MEVNFGVLRIQGPVNKKDKGGLGECKLYPYPAFCNAGGGGYSYNHVI